MKVTFDKHVMCLQNGYQLKHAHAHMVSCMLGDVKLTPTLLLYSVFYKKLFLYK